jgi:hypothetical protein
MKIEKTKTSPFPVNGEQRDILSALNITNDDLEDLVCSIILIY